MGGGVEALRGQQGFTFAFWGGVIKIHDYSLQITLSKKFGHRWKSFLKFSSATSNAKTIIFIHIYIYNAPIHCRKERHRHHTTLIFLRAGFSRCKAWGQAHIACGRSRIIQEGQVLKARGLRRRGGLGVGTGFPPSHWGRVWRGGSAPFQKKMNLVPWNGIFWCILVLIITLKALLWHSL